MKHRSSLDETVCAILGEFRVIAVVGLSPNPWRDSNRVAGYLLAHGYEVVPVTNSQKGIVKSAAVVAKYRS